GGAGAQTPFWVLTHTPPNFPPRGRPPGRGRKPHTLLGGLCGGARPKSVREPPPLPPPPGAPPARGRTGQKGRNCPSRPPARAQSSVGGGGVRRTRSSPTGSITSRPCSPT